MPDFYVPLPLCGVLILPKDNVHCCFYHVWISREDKWGCLHGVPQNPALGLSYFPPKSREQDFTSFWVWRQHSRHHCQFFSSLGAELKSRVWDWQLFLLLVVQLETTRSRSTWFTFSVFLQLTQTICSSNFGICLRMRDRPRYSPRQSSQFSWLRDKFRKILPNNGMRFSFVVYFCNLWRNGPSIFFLGKKNEECQSKKWQIREPFIMESSYITFRENGNKMICPTGNRISGLPEAEYLPLILTSPLNSLT